MGLIFKNGRLLFRDGKLACKKDDCICDDCPNCCIEILWGEFNGDGDLEVVTTGNTYESGGGPSVTGVTTTYRVILPTKNSRYVCDNQSIRVEVDYDHPDDVTIQPYTFIKWDYGWKYETETGADSELNQYGLIEWNGPFEIGPVKDTVRSVTLSFDACWLNSVGWSGGIVRPTCPDIGIGPHYPYVSESDVGEIIIGHDGVHEQHVETHHCPSEYWCCPPELECHPCCVYISSEKLVDKLLGFDTPACNHGQPDDIGAFVFWDNDNRGSRHRLRVAASTGDPFSRTICPPTVYGGNTFESDPDLELKIEIVPQEFHPDGEFYENRICIEYDSSIWELVDDPELEASPTCGASKVMCFPVSDILIRVVNFTLKCREHGKDPIIDFTSIEVTVSDETDGIEELEKHEDLNVIVPFGYCGHMDLEGGCCEDIVCERCCFAFDTAEGFIDYEITDGGTFIGTFIDCTDPENPIEVTVSIDLTDGLLCYGDSISIEVELSEPDTASKDLCISWVGNFENPSPVPVVVVDPDADAVCWPDTHDTITTYTLGLDFPAAATDAPSIAVSLGDFGGTVHFRSCFESDPLCCYCSDYDFRHCQCGCDFRVSNDEDSLLCDDGTTGSGPFTVVGGATQITDFVLHLIYVTHPCEGTDGIVTISQVGESWQRYTCVPIASLGCADESTIRCPISEKILQFNWERIGDCRDLPASGTGTITPACNPDGTFSHWTVTIPSLMGVGLSFVKNATGDCNGGSGSGAYINALPADPGQVDYDVDFDITRDYDPLCGEEDEVLI